MEDGRGGSLFGQPGGEGQEDGVIEKNLEYFPLRSRVDTHLYSSQNSFQIRDRVSLRSDAASLSDPDA